MKASTVTSFAKLLYKEKMSVSVDQIYKHFFPDEDFTCDNRIMIDMPNMLNDRYCKKSVYPVTLDISLSEEPQDAFIIGSENLGGIVLPEVRLRSVRTDTNQLLFDFALKDFQANMTLNFDDMMYPNFDYKIKFSDVRVVERGMKVKAERDVWQLSTIVNNGDGLAHDYLRDHLHPKYIAGITNRDADIKWDSELQALFVGFTPDPVFFGYNQGEPLI